MTERKAEGFAAAAAAFVDVGARGDNTRPPSDRAAPDLVAATSFDHRRKKRMPRQRRSSLDTLFHHHHSLASSSSSSHVPPTPFRLHLLPAPGPAPAPAPAPARPRIPLARVTSLFPLFGYALFLLLTSYILLSFC